MRREIVMAASVGFVIFMIAKDGKLSLGISIVGLLVMVALLIELVLFIKEELSDEQ